MIPDAENRTTIPVTATFTIEIFWPEYDRPIGSVIVNNSHITDLYFHRVRPEDADVGVEGWWRMGNLYYLHDASLVKAIEEKVISDLMTGNMRLW